MPPSIAVIGSGNIGGTLARRLVGAGREVVIGVQDPAKPATRALADELGIRATDAGGAIESSEVVILAIPGAAVPDLAVDAGSSLGTRIVIDATNAVGGDGPLNGHAAIAEAAPDAAYARAFNTLGWENFATPEIDGTQLDLIWCGPDGDAGATVAGVIRDVGLNPVRIGGLDQLPVVDAVAKLWFALVFGQGLGRRLAIQILTPAG
jgi:predicted dinucleotide-binding enzyme